jgi:hypothetical protein
MERMRRIGIVNDDIEHLFSSEMKDQRLGNIADQTHQKLPKIA